MSERFNDYFFSSGQHEKYSSEWSPLPDYPGYSICKEGYVMKDDGYILKHHKGDKKGHINIRLNKNGKVKEEYLHRLLAKTYIPNRNNDPIVRHLDDDHNNNDLSNLAWGTVKDNIHDSIRNKTNYILTDEDREKGFRKSRTPVRAINIRTGETIDFIGQNEAARALNVSQSNIFKVLSGERKHTKGYYFKRLKREVIDD